MILSRYRVTTLGEPEDFSTDVFREALNHYVSQVRKGKREVSLYFRLEYPRSVVSLELGEAQNK